MAIGDSCKTAGKYCMVAGGVTFFIMALSSTFVFDLVIIAALNKQANEAAKDKNNNPIGAIQKFVLTYWLWNFISKNSNPFVLFLFSPFVSMAAAALAVYLDVAFIAWGIAAGWGLGLALVLTGYGLYKFGQYLSGDETHLPRASRAEGDHGIVLKMMEQFGLFEVLPTAVATAIHPEADECITYNVHGERVSTSPLRQAYG